MRRLHGPSRLAVEDYLYGHATEQRTRKSRRGLEGLDSVAVGCHQVVSVDAAEEGNVFTNVKEASFQVVQQQQVVFSRSFAAGSRNAPARDAELSMRLQRAASELIDIASLMRPQSGSDIAHLDTR